MLIPKIKPSKSLVVPVPRDTNFHIPEGRYRAKITRVKMERVQKLDSVGDVVKLLFGVQVPSLPRTVNLARAEFRFDMNKGTELRNILTRLFGKEALSEAAGETFDLEKLVNLDVEIQTEHIITNRRDEYSYPLVRVCDIQKPGTMCLTEYQDANQ